MKNLFAKVSILTLFGILFFIPISSCNNEGPTQGSVNDQWALVFAEYDQFDPDQNVTYTILLPTAKLKQVTGKLAPWVTYYLNGELHNIKIDPQMPYKNYTDYYAFKVIMKYDKDATIFVNYGNSRDPENDFPDPPRVSQIDPFAVIYRPTSKPDSNKTDWVYAFRLHNAQGSQIDRSKIRSMSIDEISQSPGIDDPKSTLFSLKNPQYTKDVGISNVKWLFPGDVEFNVGVNDKFEYRPKHNSVRIYMKDRYGNVLTRNFNSIVVR